MDVSFTKGAPAAKLVYHLYTSGYSMIEMVVALAIITILLALAAPSFSAISSNAQLRGYTNQLIDQLQYARSEAVKRSQRVEMCKSENGFDCSHAGEWHQGYLIFADKNQDRQHEASEPILYIQHTLTSLQSLSYSAFPSPNYVIYYPTGLSMGNGTFTLCDRRGSKHARAVILYKTGRIRTANIKPNGDRLECP